MKSIKRHFLKKLKPEKNFCHYFPVCLSPFFHSYGLIYLDFVASASATDPRQPPSLAELIISSEPMIFS